MSDYKKRLKDFISKNDPIKTINSIMQTDSSLKLEWEQAKSNREWINIKSGEDVKKLIEFFKNTVESLPEDICLRNKHIDYVLIAQYKVICGLKKWLRLDDTISPLRSKEFPKLTEDIVNNLIDNINSIIKMI